MNARFRLASLRNSCVVVHSGRSISPKDGCTPVRIEGLEPRILFAAEPMMKDFMGINGHAVAGFDPALYGPAVKLVRDYHNMAWDVGDDTNYTTTFPYARNGVNWNNDYNAWVAGGFNIDACIQFSHIEDEDWGNIATEAYKYGAAFAKYFGPTQGTGTVRSVEIGNEPGHWEDATYRQVFQHMAQGIRDTDPALKIVTCNLYVDVPNDYAKPVSLFDGLEHLVDVYNIHTYGFVTGWPTWERPHPEDARLTYFSDVQDLIDWRNANDPTAQTWITEFGYDASTKPPPTTGTFKDFKDVTDTQQAQYIVRSWLNFSTMDVDRAYLFFYNDSDEPTLHASSGITRNFQPKESYWSTVHLQNTLGNYRYTSIVQKQTNGTYAFQYVKNGDPTDIIWAVWSATGNNTSATKTLSNLPGQVTKVERMPLASGAAPTVSYTTPGAGQISLNVNESVTYIHMKVQAAPAAVVSGQIFNDADGNGAKNGSEAGISGRTIFDDVDNDGVLDANERSTTTNASGNYTLTQLAAGTHNIRQVVPAGWTQTAPAGNGAHIVTLTNNQTVTGRNFGVRQTPTNNTVTLQAETATLSGGTFADKLHSGYLGTGYADYADNGSAVQWTVNRAAAGNAKLEFRYANGSTAARPLTVYVNNVNVGTLQFAATGAWNKWLTTSITKALNAGNNTIRLVAGGFGPNIDQLVVSNATLTPAPAVYQAESAALSGATVASDRAGYTGSGFADYNANSGSYVQFTVNAATAASATLAFRYSNGNAAARPLTIIVNGITIATPSFASTGNWTTWATTTIAASLKAGANTVRLVAGIGGGPNLDSLTVTLV